MARYDHGGGCACGLVRVCDCGSKSQSSGSWEKAKKLQEDREMKYDYQYDENNVEDNYTVNFGMPIVEDKYIPRSTEPRYDVYDRQVAALREIQDNIYRFNCKQGWWDKPREVGTVLCLIHSEISEAMEGDRKNLMDTHLTDRKMIEVELADAMIRIFDLAGHLKLDLGGALQAKHIYNQHRQDHKREVRALEGGKKY